MGLAGSVGAAGLWVMGVSASAPMIVLVGGISVMYAATGLVSVGLAFLALAVALLPVTVAVMGAARHVSHAATLYALLAQGLGRVAGAAGGAVALLCYSAIQCSPYGLVGFVVSSSPLGGRWWVWALVAWAAVALLGGVSLVANVAVIAVGVGLQLVLVGAVVWSALAHPADGAISGAGLSMSGLWAGGLGGVGGALAFGAAALIGYESPASYVEETRDSRAVLKAAVMGLLCLGVGYTVVAWAVSVGYGPGFVVDVARDPQSGMPLSLLGGGAALGVVVLLLAIGAALLSFHNLVARYVYRMGRDGVLPARLGGVATGSRAGAPTAAALVQSVVSLAVILTVAGMGADPFTGLFVPASTLAAVGVLALLTVGALASGRFFARGGGTRESRMVWVLLLPTLGVLGGGGVLAVVVGHLDELLGVAPGALSTRVVPGLILLVALLGGLRGWWLRAHRPDVYAGIGRGTPRHAARLDPRLAGLPL